MFGPDLIPGTAPEPSPGPGPEPELTPSSPELRTVPVPIGAIERDPGPVPDLGRVKTGGAGPPAPARAWPGAAAVRC